MDSRRSTVFTSGALGFLWLLLFCPIVEAVVIEMVPVGNPGNAPDIHESRPPIGSVDHNYYIGKYEITAGQYTEFLNAVAKDDPNGLYNTAMADSWQLVGANIQRSGTGTNFSYSVAADWANRPVNYVSIWDAARFANWLHNGQPIGPQGPGTTEDGAYHDVGHPALFGRSPGAKFFIPNNNEWYKAAYHNEATGLAANYFEFPTGTNSAPGNDATEATSPSNNANYLTYKYSISVPYWRTLVGQYHLSASPYGTFDQGGNVAEWTETVDPTSRLPGHVAYGMWGGSFADPYGLRSIMGGSFYAGNEYEFAGFRVAAAVPEPGSLVVCVTGVLTILIRMRLTRSRLISAY